MVPYFIQLALILFILIFIDVEIVPDLVSVLFICLHYSLDRFLAFWHKCFRPEFLTFGTVSAHLHGYLP